MNRVLESDPDVEANLSTIFQQIRGTKQFWFLRSSNLKCMLRVYGSPTLFLTFSCAEYQSPDIIGYLRKVPDSYPIGRLCCEDPISVSLKFSSKFHHFFNTVILKGCVLGTVSHYFVKKEYQARGAPHYHMVLWIEGAPTIGKDTPEKVTRWIQERISCRIPDEESNPELYQLVTRYQMHKCSSYCRRTKRVNKAFVTRCKFGFPREASKDGALKCVEDCLKSQAKIYSLPRADSEIRVNDYSPVLLMLGGPTWTSSLSQSLHWLWHTMSQRMSQKLSEAICRKYGKRLVPTRASTAAFGVSLFEAYAHVSVASMKHLISSCVITFVRNQWSLNGLMPHGHTRENAGS